MLGQKTLRLYSQAAFIRLFITVFGCVCLDMMSLLTIRNQQVVGEGVNAIVCKAYLLSITLVAFMLLSYTFIEIHRSHKQMKTFFSISIIPVIVEICVLFLFPIQIFNENGKIYTYGTCVHITYVISLFYLAISFFYTIHYKTKMLQQTRLAVWLLIGAWVFTALIQMFHNELLLVGFAMCVAMVYMYATLENPQIYIDMDTQTYNAYAFVSYLEKSIGAKEKVWIVAIQLEGLRFVNENFGVKSGKKLIQNIVAFFSKAVPGEVKLFRIGEDSFGLLYEESADMKAAVKTIKQRFQEPWEVQGMHLSLDCGIVYLQDSNLIETGEGLAETIFYFLKESKRREKGEAIRIDITEIYRKNRLVEAEKTLRWALDNNTVEVYYQPIYSVTEEKFNTVEALVRIVDEKKQVIMPDEFIPIAEQTGLILDLGLKVFEKTCQFMQQEKIENYGISCVEINLSVVQCMQEKLASQLLTIMKSYRIDPSRISLEITETAAAQSERVLLRNMQELGKVGTSFAMDDYGTGYSNLSYIINLPIQIIKLDKSMVWSFFSNERAAIATRHAIEMIKEMGMKVVAEGVETKKHYDSMQKLGVDYVQGYYFSKPLSRKDLLTFLDKNNV